MTLTVTVEPSFLALTITPSIGPSFVEATRPVSAAATCAGAGEVTLERPRVNANAATATTARRRTCIAASLNLSLAIASGAGQSRAWAGLATSLEPAPGQFNAVRPGAGTWHASVRGIAIHHPAAAR